MRALAAALPRGGYLVWPEGQTVVVNLEAPIILLDRHGAECEAGGSGDYAAAVRVVPQVDATRMNVPLCDMADGLCVYTTLGLAAAD